MTTVRDIMTSAVITVTVGTTIKDLCHLLNEFDINGMPVVSETQSLVGIVSEKDIIAHQVASIEPDYIDPDIYELVSSKHLGHDDFHPGQNRMYVEEVMNRDVVIVAPDASIKEASLIMLEKNLHRLPVVEDGRVIGIVSSLDLLRAKMREDS